VTRKNESVQLPGKNKKPGQIISLAKALERGLVNEGQVADEQAYSVQRYRDPSYEELVESMSDLVDGIKLSKLTQRDLTQVLADRYAKGSLKMDISLVKQDGDEYAKDLEKLIASAPEDKRAALTNLTQDETKGLPLDACDFVADVIFAASYAQDSADLAERALSKVSGSLIQSSGAKASFGAVSFGKAPTPGLTSKVARRRAKNKAAAKSRRKNRSA
jgi:hypothetical protein